MDHSKYIEIRDCFFKNVTISENLIEISKSQFFINSTNCINVTSSDYYIILSSLCNGTAYNFSCKDCISGAIYLKDSSFSMQNSIFLFTFFLSNPKLKCSALYAESNPEFINIFNTKFLNLRHDFGPVNKIKILFPISDLFF